ncbi:TIGR01777 family oxidoreductase [Corynebacterium sp.]|uniref:TIGR01777 family oxidoreductase n=1 Tax=Corynebacterium sp. TaxID=1720 RepID=UPI0026DB9BD8|nr:TIGR01777 family oxidoreductase [Corynebacterium sp.]MDO5031509.1 TIGR01777 family oxidoreductase [Corynebacterium sp.]
MSFQAQHVVPAERNEVWHWHTRAGALTRLTPPFTFMTPLSQAESLADGTSVLGIAGGLKWVARHDLSRYLKGHSFSDVCISAPMRALAQWRHDHRFSDHPQGTLITDTVDTRIPGSALESIFAYRQRQLIGDISFAQQLGPLNERPLTIALTGSHGGVGRALAAQLSTLGHTVIPLVRSAPTGPTGAQRLWRPEDPTEDLLRGADVLIHLAGEPIFGRFNSAHKKDIRSSRVEPTRRLAELAARTEGLRAMICASAIGFYGPDRGSTELHEDSSRGEGFLADVVADWEAACQPARDGGVRVVSMRTGVVLSGNSGVLPIMRALFSTGLGGSLGKGNFWYSWVALDDLTDMYVRAALDESWEGAFNAVSPTPVLNKDFGAALGGTLKRPAVVPIPTLGPALLLGKEGARELALADQKVLPARVTQHGHVFRYPTIEQALAHELGAEQLVETSTA